MDAGATKKSYLPGNYREFEIDLNGEIVQLSKESENYSFIFHYSGDSADIAQLVCRYANDYREETGIIVYTDKGERIMSWMCK